MKSITFLLLTFYSIAGLAQTLDLTVYSLYTAAPIENATVLLTSNDLKFQLEYQSDSMGNVSSELPVDLCNEKMFNIRISKPEFYTEFFIANCQSNDTLQLEIWLEEDYPKCYSAPSLKFAPGEINPIPESEIELTALVAVVADNPDLKWVMNFGYCSSEQNGYELSIERANSLMAFLSTFGFDGDELMIKVEETDLPYSRMYLENAGRKTSN